MVFFSIQHQGCGISGLCCFNQPINQSISLLQQKFLHCSDQMISKKLIGITLGDWDGPHIVLPKLLFYLRLNNLLRSLYKCLGSLSCYIMIPLSFKCFPSVHRDVQWCPFFNHFLNIRKVLFLLKNPQIITESLSCFTVGVCAVTSSVLRAGVKRNGGTYSQTVKPCTRLWITLVPIHYLPSYISRPIEVFSSCLCSVGGLYLQPFLNITWL